MMFQVKTTGAVNFRKGFKTIRRMKSLHNHNVVKESQTQL